MLIGPFAAEGWSRALLIGVGKFAEVNDIFRENAVRERSVDAVLCKAANEGDYFPLTGSSLDLHAW